MKDKLQNILSQVVREMGAGELVVEVGIPEDPQFGDYTTNVALRLSKVLKKSPMDVALQVKNVLQARIDEVKINKGNHSTDQTDQKDAADLPQSSTIDFLQDISEINIAAPGFINFKMSEAKLSTNVLRLLNEDQLVSTIQTKGKKITVEYTDPNPFKELHIGHLYSNAVGESLCRLYEAVGWEVKRADYYGDVGMHVAKSVWGMKKQLATQEVALVDIEKKPLRERVKWMGQAYALGSKVFEEDKQVAEEIKSLNKRLFIAAQRLAAKKSSVKSVVDYAKGEDVDEKELDELTRLFETGRQWSLDYFETMYARLGTKFDYYYPESEVAEYGAKLVLDNVGKVFENSDGAIVYRGEKVGLHTRVFINSLNLPTYEAKELGLNWKKDKDFPADVSIIVTGNEINEYFKVLLSAMGEVTPGVAKKTRHIGHGMVRLPQGKMSSRTGNVVTAEDMIDTVKEHVLSILNQSETKYTKEDQSTISEKAAIAAIKYSLLRVSLPSDIVFDVDKSVSFDGDSGPYLQYTYARCMSVVRKATNIKKEVVSGRDMNAQERDLSRHLYYFSEIVQRAAEDLSPNTLCTYLFELAQLFNSLYAKHSILSGDAVAGRVILTQATANVLRKGLYLLGIETLERM